MSDWSSDVCSSDRPARCGALGAGADACEVRSRSGLAHPDAEEDFAATDARQIVPTLFLAAEIQDQRRALPVGDPVRRDRSAERQQFLDDDETREGAALATAIVARQRQAEKTRLAELATEGGVETLPRPHALVGAADRKSTRLNSS